MLGTLIIWALGSLPFGVEYASEFSLLGIVGGKLKFLFHYAGFGFWQAAVALIFGLMAKEIVISSFAALLASNGSSLGIALKEYFTPLSALSFMLMILLYSPCIGTIATFQRETKSWGWTIFMVLYTFFAATLVSTLFYQLGSKFFVCPGSPVMV
jgi:ferrous iron transport protein B